LDGGALVGQERSPLGDALIVLLDAVQACKRLPGLFDIIADEVVQQVMRVSGDRFKPANGPHPNRHPEGTRPMAMGEGLIVGR
jgi:hypothetical protein